MKNAQKICAKTILYNIQQYIIKSLQRNAHKKQARNDNDSKYKSIKEI